MLISSSCFHDICISTVWYVPHFPPFLSSSLHQGVIDGSWACWSSWTSCSQGRRSRSRSCSNPSPQRGGQHCIGEPAESAECDDQELEYLKSERVVWPLFFSMHSLKLHNEQFIIRISSRTMEPQCFDNTLQAPPKCETPPSLINGYVLVRWTVETAAFWYNLIYNHNNFRQFFPVLECCPEDKTNLPKGAHPL